MGKRVGMSALWRRIRSFLFFFDAEKVHHFSVRILQWMGRGRLRRKWIALSVGGALPTTPPERVDGLYFRNRLGLAAGFDKNAELLKVLPSFGFGFAEIGTVTPESQPGNPKPRLFRDARNENLFNRMGFNNAGAAEVARNVHEARASGVLPVNFRIGVNVGKMKETPVEGAARDFARAASFFEHGADYLVVNVSSPNTPGLRALQTVEALREIIAEVKNTLLRWRITPPLFLKLAPELEETALQELVYPLEREGVDGWVLTNTWGGEWRRSSGESLPGGWSGKFLKEVSRSRLRTVRSLTQKTLISVGGIDSSEEAVLRREMGADLLQLYSAWVFQGPSLPRRISESIQRADQR